MGSSSGATAGATVSQTAGLALSAPIAKIGAPLTVTGDGFPTGVVVSFTVPGMLLGTATTDGNGHVSLSFNAPGTRAGSVSITARTLTRVAVTAQASLMLAAGTTPGLLSCRRPHPARSKSPSGARTSRPTPP